MFKLRVIAYKYAKIHLFSSKFNTSADQLYIVIVRSLKHLSSNGRIIFGRIHFVVS